MSDPVTRLNAALEGRYAIERELGEGGTRKAGGQRALSSVGGVSLEGVSGLSAATFGEQLLGEVRLIPQALQFVLQQFDPFVLLG